MYRHVGSSWNPDRVGSCVISKPHRERQPRKASCFALYRGNEVSVCGARGKKRFTLKFDQTVVSAIVRDDQLVVTTADECVRHYDVATRKLVAEIRPVSPDGGSAGIAFSFAA